MRRLNWLRRLLGENDSHNIEDGESIDPEISALVGRARALSREVEPERDLWLGVQHRIEHPENETRPGLARTQPSFFRTAAVVAGLVTLVAGTSALTLMMSEPSISLDDPEQVRAIANALRERDGVSGVRTSLLELLELRRDELPPNTVAILEENLQSIDLAIAEIHVALRDNPDNHALIFLLAEAYRHEANLLDRVEWWMGADEEARS